MRIIVVTDEDEIREGSITPERVYAEIQKSLDKLAPSLAAQGEPDKATFSGGTGPSLMVQAPPPHKEIQAHDFVHQFAEARIKALEIALEAERKRAEKWKHMLVTAGLIVPKPYKIPDNMMLISDSSAIAEHRESIQARAKAHYVDLGVTPIMSANTNMMRSLRPGEAPGEAVVILLKLPEPFKGQWDQEGRVGEDTSDPHFTILYMGEDAVPDERKEEFLEIVQSVISTIEPFEVKFAPGVHWFTSNEGREIAHRKPDVQSEAQLRSLHEALRFSLELVGFEIKHATPYIAHATLAYLSERKYDKPTPDGSFMATEVFVEGWPETIRLSF